MKVKISILDGKNLKNNYTIPTIFEGKGDYALPLVITVVSEIYYGQKVRILLEDILKHQLTAEEINSNLNVYLEKRK